MPPRTAVNNRGGRRLVTGTTAPVSSTRRQTERNGGKRQLHNNEETVYTVVLETGGELPQRDIVEETDLSKATVSRTLDTLESKGLVERKRKGMGNVVVPT